jgi:hypothetical protein
MRIFDSYEFAAQVHRYRGHAVHHGCALIDQGETPTLSIPANASEEIRKAAFDIENGYWPAYRRFKARTGFQGQCYECSLVDPIMGFGGTFDVMGTTPPVEDEEGNIIYPGEVWLPDLKSGEVLPKMVPCQTALYKYLLTHGKPVNPRHPGWDWVQEIVRAGTPIRCKAIRLQRDGTPTIYAESTKPVRSYDDPYWTVLARSAVNLYNGLNDNGLLEAA